jgi:magnesium transporter
VNITIETLDIFYQQAVKNPHHPSAFFDSEQYDVLIIRLPVLVDDELEFSVDAFVLIDESIYHYQRDKGEFVEVESFAIFIRLIRFKVANVLKTVTSYFDTVDEIEDSFYGGKSVKNFNQVWFEHKIEMVKINRGLFKTNEVISEFIDTYQGSEKFEEAHFNNVQDHLQRAHRHSGLLLAKLDTLKAYNTTKNDEKMNQTIYVLTLLSGIFLPLNFMVGFFGMNTTDLPFTKDANGTTFAILLLITIGMISAVLTLFLKRR